MNDEVQLLTSIEDAKACAGLMSSCEPWLTLGRSCDDCLKVFLDRSHDTFIRKEGGKLLAFCVVQVNRFPQPYIKSLAVQPGFQRKGIGTSLLEWVEQKYGYINGRIYIAVSSFNTGAMKLYERTGYTKIAEFRDYFVTGHSEILLEKITVKSIRSGHKDSVFATDDRDEMDIDFIYNNLRHLYWAKNLTKENLIGRIMNSWCFGVFVNGSQKAFARVITDYFSFAYLADVFVEESERGKGYSKLMMRYIFDNPKLEGIKWLLATKDLHGMYTKYGFVPVNNPERFMGMNGWLPFSNE